MMRLRLFSVIALVLVVAFSLLAVRYFLGNNNEQTLDRATGHHFSVRWMGFAPTDYDNSFPEYAVCINDLKDNPMRMQIALQIKNQEDQGYYFLVDKYAAPTEWTIEPLQVGYIDVDETNAFVYDKASRPVPSSIPQGRLTQIITLVVKAYYDEAYSNLYSQDTLDVTFNLLDRLSSEWTILYNDNFDNQNAQEWVVAFEGYRDWEARCSASANIAPSPDYYRSFQYSLKLVTSACGLTWWTPTGYVYYYAWAKGGYGITLQIPSASEAYLLFSLKSDNYGALSDHGIMINGITYFKTDVVPESGKWYQFAVPLPTDSTSTVEIWVSSVYSGYSNPVSATSYLDDVYVISK
jgi:hypothetical protein